MKNTNRCTIKYLLVICAMVVGLTGCDQLGLTRSKVAYIDVAKVLADSPIGKQETQHNQQVKEVLVKADRDAQERYKTMPEPQQRQSRAADAMNLNQLWLAEQNRARELSIKAVTAETEKYRLSQKLDMVMSRAQVVAADPANDVTAEIIAGLKDVKVDYGALPEISVVNKDEPAKNTEAPAKEPY